MASSNTPEFRARVKSALEAGIITGDGHTLFAPEFYAPHFSEAELQEAELIQTHRSDGTGKGSIFGSDGAVIQELHAVYNLEFLYWLNGELETGQYPTAMGRGSQAQQLVEYIAHALS